MERWQYEMMSSVGYDTSEELPLEVDMNGKVMEIPWKSKTNILAHVWTILAIQM